MPCAWLRSGVQTPADIGSDLRNHTIRPVAAPAVQVVTIPTPRPRYRILGVRGRQAPRLTSLATAVVGTPV